MAVDILTKWQTELLLLPKVADTSWALTFATWAEKRVSKANAVDSVGLFPDPAMLVPSTFTFTFNVATFAAQLISLGPTSNALDGITAFANAWATAIAASTAVVAASSFKPPTSPATLFSVVASTVIDPASIAAGKAKIITLALEPAPTGQASKFPEKFRDAFKLLTITVTGTDSTPTPAGPLPLTVPTVKLL